MQSVTRKQIMPGAELTCVNSDKFKTACLSVNLITPLDEKTASLNAAIPSVLRRGTARDPDMESLSVRLDELYGARIEPVVRKKGELQCVGLYSDFIDDAYVPDGTSLLEKAAALLGEMLLMPATSGGRLLEKYVSGERANLMDKIGAEINDKRQYSINRLVGQMCAGEKYGVNKLGSAEAAEKISVDSMTKQYKKLIGTAKVEFFYCGSASPSRVERAVLESFSDIPRIEDAVVPGAEIISAPAGGVRYFTQEMDVTQGKLAIGFRMGDAIERFGLSELIVFNAVYGGAVTSKLFKNVREKLSLCYFASSMVDKMKGVMIVSSGIEFDKYDHALGEILAQLDAVKTGNIDDDELDGAKKVVITALKAAMDSPEFLEDFYIDSSIMGIDCTPEEMTGLVDEVKKEDVVSVARCAHEDSVYFLKGKDGGGDEV